MNIKTFTITGAFKNVSSVCFILKTFCEDLSVPEDRIREVELSLAEALNNIIKHAYKCVETNNIDVQFKFENNRLEIELTDYGEARKNLNKPILEFDPDDINSLPEGGMGLFIIEQLMDENKYLRIGNKNIFTLVKKL